MPIKGRVRNSNFDKVLKNQSKHCIFIAKLRVVIPLYFQYTEYVDLNWSMRIKTSKWCPFLELQCPVFQRVGLRSIFLS